VCLFLEKMAMLKVVPENLIKKRQKQNFKKWILKKKLLKYKKKKTIYQKAVSLRFYNFDKV
jgi:hypothetical protein